MVMTPQTRMKDASVGVLVSIGAMVVAGIARLALSTRVSTSVVFAVLTIALTTLPTVVRKIGRVDERALGMRMLATLGWLPLIAMTVLMNQGPLATTRTNCGTGLVAAIFIMPVLAVPLLSGAAGLAVVAGKREVDKLIHVASTLVLAIVVGTAGFAASQILRPDSDTYLSHVPTARVLPEGESFVIDGVKVTYLTSREEKRVDPNTPPMTTRCLLTGLSDQQGPHDLWAAEADGTVTAPGVTGPCPMMTFRHDDKSNVWLIYANDHPLGFVTHGGSLQNTLYESDVRRSIGPPIGWTIAGIFAAVLGAALLFLSRNIARRPMTLNAIEGFHRGEGWVDIPDRSSVHIASLQPALVGPVLLTARPGSIPTYRKTGEEVLELLTLGGLDEMHSTFFDRAASLRAAAFAGMLLLSTPLMVYLLLP
jgi:hypothetical protein